jgi:uncharacterized protein (TIGR03437 family)
MRTLPFVLALITIASSRLPADSSPKLEWVKTFGGSGSNNVVAAATDSAGNLYIAGTTSSLDFPVASAAQRNAGASTLVRINAATNAAEKLYSPSLTAAANFVADPRNPQTLYATNGGAVIRSTDAGSTWAFLSQVAPGASATSLAASGNILYAGTPTQGAFKSGDGGLTWTAISDGIPPAGDGTLNIYQLWADPKSPQLLFAYTYRGLMRSTNGGAAWTPVTSPVATLTALTFDPLVPGTLYLAGYVAGSQSLYKSTDNGQTFTPLQPLPDLSGPTSLIADPSHAGVLYAGSFSGIYQSVDSGLTWVRKAAGLITHAFLLAADPNSPALYANLSNYGIVKSTDSFTTTTPIGPPETRLRQILVAGPNVFVWAETSTDVFAVKLDPNGNVVYSTYFGGSADDTAAAMAVGPDGSMYVTGTTWSIDFPATKGAFATALAAGSTSSTFLFKLNPDGSPGWATYFADMKSKASSVAVDAAGHPYIGGSAQGNLPTTPGAYQTTFQQTETCTGMIGCFPGPTSAFVAKFDSAGASLVYSTYIPTDDHQNTVTDAKALVLDANGNAWLASRGNVVELNAAGSALLASTLEPNINIAALALDSNSNVYAAGSASAGFLATPGAFQPVPQPAVPTLPGEISGGGGDAFAIKWDGHLSKLAATLIGGELTDAAGSIAIDKAGNAIVCGSTDSKGFPTHAPFQTGFSVRSGFVAGLDSSLSHLLFSTYLGDDRPFEARGVGLDGDGNILLAGSMLNASSLFIGGDPGQSFNVASTVAANKIALSPSPAPRLDSVVNLASKLAGAVAPGETVMAVGSGFGPDAQLLVDGSPLNGLTGTATTLVAAMPESAKIAGAFVMQVSTGWTLSNPVFVAAAPAAPGIYSTDGSGVGQGYILNSDGTLNSPANPVAQGSPITIVATGVGGFTLDGPYAVTALAPAVFIDGFYANGIAAFMGPVAGIPGDVYQLSVFVPDPAKLADQNPNNVGFKMPPRVGVRLVMGPVTPGSPDSSAMVSQPGIVLNVK